MTSNWRCSFVFGGTDKVNNQTYEDSYVLSLPGFVWHKIQAPSGGGPRSNHQCVVVAGNKMLSVGGTNDNLRWPDTWTRADPFPHGLGILDLTELRWSSDYDSTYKAYKSPEVVRNWYARALPVEWASPEVQQLFAASENGTGRYFACRQSNASRLFVVCT